MNERRTLGERLVQALGGVTSRQLADVKQRAFESGMAAGVDSGNDEPGIATADGKLIGTGYKSTAGTPRDLSSLSQERAIDATYRLWNTHPMAKAITEILVDYVLGNGIELQADTPEVRQVLEEFLRDPVNRLQGQGAESLVRELSLFGEQLHLAFVRSGEDTGGLADGRLRLAPVDPKQIHSLITDPDNRMDVLAVRLKDKNGSAGKLYRLVRAEAASGIMKGVKDYAKIAEAVKARAAAGGTRLAEAEAQAEASTWTARLREGREWRWAEAEGRPGVARITAGDETIKDLAFDGECFLHQVNRLSTGVRGRPDILPLIDWLDRLDTLFFDSAEHVAALNAFVWDLEVKGGSETAREPEKNLTRQAQKITAMRPNSVYAHNENVVLEAKNPDLKTGDIQQIVRALRVFIAGGMRVPEHWLAEGGYTNRATAAEMGEPTYRMLTRRQSFVSEMLEDFCRYQIDVKVALGQLPAEVALPGKDDQPSAGKKPARDAFKIKLPDISVKDTASAANAFGVMADAVLKLVIANKLPLQQGLELLAAVAALVGVTLDPDAIAEKLAEEGVENATSTALADLIAKIDRDRPGGGDRQPPADEPAEDDGAGAA